MHALWKVRISVVWFHPQQFFAQAHASMLVDLPAFNILHRCHKNRSSHRSPQSPPKSKFFLKWARDSFFHHSGSSPLLSTCRSSSHAKPLLWVVVLLQCAEIAAHVLFPYLGGLRNISLALGNSKANESLVNVLRSSRSIMTPRCVLLPPAGESR